MRIELTRTILFIMSSNFIATNLKFAEKFDHPFSHVFIFGNMFRESRGFVAMPLTSSKNFVSMIHVPIYPYLISEGNEIVRAFDWHSNDTVTLMNYFTKNKYMRKWIVEFLSKSESRGNIIPRVNK